MESVSDSSKKSYGQILKSSAVIGSSSAVTMILGFVRAKTIAVLLGTGGGGIWAICWSITELARGVAGMGINTSGVRQIAEAVGTGDQIKIARTVITLRRVSLVLGVLGAVLLLALCVPIGRLSFGDDNYTLAVALLSLTVLMSVISQGQTALIQGMRRIGDLARINVIGAVCGTILCVPTVYFLREQGIVPALIGVALMTMLASWWFARRIKVEPLVLSSREVLGEASGLLRLGFLFMISGLMTLGVSYVVNIILLHKIDKHAVGLYQAAWLLGGYFAGFICTAMGSDFYPRLTAAAKNHAECNRLVNEQAEVGLLLAGPGLIATLVFAPLAILVTQSAEFLPAVTVLRWIATGMLLRIIAWPMGFVMLAKNAQRMFFVSEVSANVVYLLLVWFAVGIFGLNGVGFAFAVFYALYATAVWFIVNHMTGFRWSTEMLRIGAAYIAIAGGVLFAYQKLAPTTATIIGAVALLATGTYSVTKLCRMIPPARFPRRVRQLLVWLRLLPSPVNG